MADELTIKTTPKDSIQEGGIVRLEIDPLVANQTTICEWQFEDKSPLVLTEPEGKRNTPVVHWDTSGLRTGGYKILVNAKSGNRSGSGSMAFTVKPRPVAKGDATPVVMRRTEQRFTNDLFLWSLIRKTTGQLSFDNYSKFIDLVLCKGGGQDNIELEALKKIRFLPYNDTDAYRLLKVATEAFLLANCEVVLDKASSAQLASELSSRGVSVPDGANFANYLEKVTGKDADDSLLTLELL